MGQHGRLLTALLVAAAVASMGPGNCKSGPPRWADVTLDGYVDDLDAALVADCAAGLDDPRCPLADVDHDGDVDGDDLDRVAALPTYVLFDTSQPYVATRVHPGDGGDLYVLDLVGGQLHRWSLDRGRMLMPIDLGVYPTMMAWVPAHSRIYVAYLDGTIEAIDPRRPDVRTPFASLTGRPWALVAAGAYLYAQGQDGYDFAHITFRADGTIASQREDWEGQAIWNPAEERIYWVRSNTSPRALLWQHLDPATGALTYEGQVSGHNELAPPLRLHAGLGRLFLGSGQVRDLPGAAYAGRIALGTFEPVDGLWLSDGNLVTLREEGDRTRLDLRSPELRRLDARVFDGEMVRVVEHAGRIVVVTQGAAQPAFHEYTAGDDADGDGVPFAVDAFPVDAAASLDSDWDGFPDAWNPGSGAADSTTGLAIDAFPFDAACQAPEHAVPGQPGVCDLLAQLPSGSPAGLATAGDGVVYLLEDYPPAIQRWETSSGIWLDPIALGHGEGTPRHIVFSPALGRLFVAYSSGEITQIDPAMAFPMEEQFATAIDWARGMAAAGPFLVTSTYTLNAPDISVFDGAGTLREIQFHEDFWDPVWSAAQGRLYYRSGGTWSDLASRPLDPVTGALGPESRDPHFIATDLSVQRVLGVSQDGARVIVRSAQIFDGDTLAIQTWLPDAVNAALWLADGRLLTIRTDGADGTLLEQWDGELRLAHAAAFPGDPVGLLDSAGTIVVVTHEYPQSDLFVYDPVIDADGDGVPVGSDAFPLDPAASLDADGDGAPEAWNPGKGPEDSTQGLVLDVFPDDPACQRPEHSVGGVCDYRLVIPADPGDPACSADFLPPGATVGYVETPPSRDMIPLCSGWALVSENEFPEGWWIALRNMIDGRLGAVFPVPAEPHLMVYDPARHRAYVALPDPESIATIDLVAGTVTTTFVDRRVSRLELDDVGNIIWSYSSSLWLLPVDGGPMLGSWNATDAATAHLWDSTTGTLLTGGNFHVGRYDLATGYPQRILQIDTPKISALALSPDGAHLAYATWNGAEAVDLDAGDFQSAPGTWATGTSHSLAFDPGGTLLAAGTDSEIRLFDVPTHALVESVPAPVAGCGQVYDVGFSRGGTLLVGRQNCSGLTRLLWKALP